MKQITKDFEQKDSCEFWHKYSWILWDLLILAIIICLLVCDIFICCEGWSEIFSNIHNFLDEHILFTGLVSTIIGLIILFWICKPHLYIRRPQIKELYGSPYLVTRFFNTGLFKIHSIHVELQGYWYEGDERKTSTIILVKEDIPVMQGPFAKTSDNAYRIWGAVPLNPNELFDPKWEGIRCRVSATNSFSGLTYVYEKEISIKAIKDEYNEKIKC